MSFLKLDDVSLATYENVMKKVEQVAHGLALKEFNFIYYNSKIVYKLNIYIKLGDKEKKSLQLRKSSLNQRTSFLLLRSGSLNLRRRYLK